MKENEIKKPEEELKELDEESLGEISGGLFGSNELEKPENGFS